MGVLYISFSLLFKIFSIISFIVVLAIVISHFVCRFKRPKPLKLNSDSIVIVVGACMGIGKIMAIQIARLYHSTILLVDRRKQLFQQVSKQIKKQNGICQCFLCDLSDLKAVDHLVETIKQQRKRIDFLIYNAGVMIPNLAWQTSQEQFNTVMNVNFFAPVKIINGLLPRLENGHIAVVASVLSITQGIAQQSAYISSKHAIFGYLNSFRQQLKKYKRNITVSIGCPYAINTKLFEGFKTKLDKILPVLQEEYVGERLVNQFVNKKEVCFVGRRHAFMAKILKFLPTYLSDWILITINQSDFKKNKNKKEK